MTAVVGILNKHAVAIAADSAVTVEGVNGRKIFNKANKVFSLSKFQPIGILIYNAASFMATPWETIIKVYRKQLKDKSFPTVKDYKDDFIAFLREKNFFTDQEMQLNFLGGFVESIIQFLIQNIRNDNKALFDIPSEENKDTILKKLEEGVDLLITEWNQNTNFCEEFLDYTYENFESYSQVVFSNIIDLRFTQNGLVLSNALIAKLKKGVYIILKAKEINSNFTGLIFTGYGEDEIYPQLVPLNISFVCDNRLRHFIDENRGAAISNYNLGAVCPFAQTDVIDTILTGVDPSLNSIYLKNFTLMLQKYNKAILDSIGTQNPLLTTLLQSLDSQPIINEFVQMNNQIQQENYISPLIAAVSNLSKEDLAEMAESLIYLTYLKRRITFAEESVGGPVDVAIISKGDGFTWIKRKLYFSPELNQHFFANYFNK